MSSIGPEEDRNLHQRFAELRRQDTARAPEFAALLRPRAKRTGFSAFSRLAIAVACVLVITVTLARYHSRPPAKPVPSLSEWRSPTDFLLQTPGRELLIGVPRLGEWPQGIAVPGSSPSPIGTKKAI
ncbi:MAG TPA: hypothetical protein VF532_20020 [Candidatus Angelobacter sp.]